MRVTRAIDRFLVQMQLEHDWTARTIASVYAVLVILDQEHPDANLADFDGREGLDRVRALIGKHWGRRAASTRATRISYFHSFFAWAEEEGYLDDDQVRKIKRPPARKPDTYKPTAAEIDLLLRAATRLELAPLLLMSGAGLRADELVNVKWSDVDLTDGKVRVRRKGRNWQWLPVDPLVTASLRNLYRKLEPQPNHHVYVAETELWISNEHRIRRLIDPSTPRSTKALWSMVARVSKRAGVHHLGPHTLRRGFANRFLRDTRDRFGTADVWTLQLLMGHSRIDTTEKYLTDLQSDEAADVFYRLRSEELSQSEGEEPLRPLHPAFPLMEAAGIEPASSADSQQSAADTGDEPRLDPHKRRQSSEQDGDDA